MKTLCCSQCLAEAPAGTLGRCANCEGILRPEYCDETVRSLVDLAPGNGIDRYRSLMPVNQEVPYLGEGNTPLIPSRRIAG